MHNDKTTGEAFSFSSKKYNIQVNKQYILTSQLFYPAQIIKIQSSTAIKSIQRIFQCCARA